MGPIWPLKRSAGRFLAAFHKTLCTKSILMAGTQTFRRVMAISDLHVDYKENLGSVQSWSTSNYGEDVLIVAGDVTDKLDLLETTLKTFTEKFARVFYVPGNHELWIRSKESTDSIQKFDQILALCRRIGVEYTPAKIHVGDDTQSTSVWLVPLFSWYSKPEQDPEDSIYRKPPPQIVENVEFAESVWMDNHLCRWDTLAASMNPSRYFSQQNETTLSLEYGDTAIISFSHFLPRWDLIPMDEIAQEKINIERHNKGLCDAPRTQGGTKGFNFSRYAGSQILERQIRKLNSAIHIYGHQHRNRDREIDGIRYISHCLGNPQEQKEGWVWGISHWKGPRQVWPII